MGAHCANCGSNPLWLLTALTLLCSACRPAEVSDHRAAVQSSAGEATQKDGSEDERPVAERAPANVVEISAVELSKSYLTNPAASKARFEDKRLIVTGTIKNRLSINDPQRLVSLAGFEDLNKRAFEDGEILFYPDAEHFRTLRIGQKVRLSCSINLWMKPNLTVDNLDILEVSAIPENAPPLDPELTPQQIADFEKSTAVALAALEKLGVHFIKPPQLKVFLDGQDLTDRGTIRPDIWAQIKAMHGCEELDVTAPQLSDDGLAQIAQIPRLSHLDIEQFDGVSDAGCAALGRMSGLQYLTLRYGARRTDKGLAPLRNLAHLTYLEIHPDLGTKQEDLHVTGTGFEFLAGMTNLTYLGLARTPLSDDDLSAMATLVRLETLNLQGVRVEGPGVKQLRNCRRLREIDWTESRLGDSGLKFLAALPVLDRLRLGKTNVTDAGLLELAGSKSLDTVIVSQDGRVTLEGARKLRELLPQVKVSFFDH